MTRLLLEAKNHHLVLKVHNFDQEDKAANLIGIHLEL